MEQRLETIIRDLRKLGSGGAADWLMKTCPAGSDSAGDAIALLPRLSWKKPDQFKLARHYLSKIPYASPKPYEAFTSFMSLNSVIRILEEFLPSRDEDRSLLKYHLQSVLNAAATTADGRKAVEEFLAKI